jgi:hypothetical protein
VGGDMEAALASMKSPFIMIDHHQKTMIMLLTPIQILLLVPLVKCCTTSFLSW